MCFSRLHRCGSYAVYPDDALGFGLMHRVAHSYCLSDVFVDHSRHPSEQYLLYLASISKLCPPPCETYLNGQLRLTRSG